MYTGIQQQLEELALLKDIYRKFVLKNVKLFLQLNFPTLIN